MADKPIPTDNARRNATFCMNVWQSGEGQWVDYSYDHDRRFCDRVAEMVELENEGIRRVGVLNVTVRA